MRLNELQLSPRDGVAFAGVALLLFACFVAAYYHSRAQLVADVEATLATRAERVNELLRLARAHADATAKGLLANLLLSEQGALTHPRLARLASLDVPANESGPAFAIDGPVEDSLVPANLGTLTGLGDVTTLDAGTRHEINAALALDAHFAATLADVPEAVWTYFASRRDFMLIAPALPPAEFRFTPRVHTRSYWKDAVPTANPDRIAIISDPFIDAAGAGMMTTLSVPVWRGDAFLGVSVVEFGIGSLRDAVLLDEAPGESILVNEDGLLNAAPWSFEVGTRADVPAAMLTTPSGPQLDAGTYRWSLEAYPGELMLVHALPRTTLALGTAARAAPLWLLTAFVAALLWLLLRLRRARAAALDLARTDPLTGALNRRALEERAAPLLAQSDRRSEASCVLMVDADHFKRINDEHGHGIGDEVIKGLVERIEQGVRSGDLCGRFGGEEFVVVLPLTPPKAALGVAERVRMGVANEPLSSKALDVTVSIGVAERGKGEPLNAVLERADEALYEAKSRGRNRAVFASPPKPD